MKALFLLPLLLISVSGLLAQDPNGNGQARQSAQKSALSNEDEALIAASKVTADRFLAAFDRGDYEAAEKMTFIKESPDLTGRKLEKRPVLSVYQLNQMGMGGSYGKMESREFTKSEIVEPENTALPNGRYVRLTYKVRYEKKSDAVQTVVIAVSDPQPQTVAQFP